MRAAVRARAWSAVSVLNAIATGLGGALSIELPVEVEARLEGTDGLEVEGVAGESPRLVEEVVKAALAKSGLGEVGLKLAIHSSIPVGRGLKSSSAVANAVAAACLHLLDVKAQPLDVVRLGVAAALRAGVTITGAFDDACASMLGGLVITDNRAMRIHRRETLDEGLKVVLQIPPQKVYTAAVDHSGLAAYAPISQEAYRVALRGDYWQALTLNGLLVAAAYGYPTGPLTAALKAGALAAGVSGKGPTLAAVVDDAHLAGVVEAFRGLEGEVRVVKVNNRSGGVL
jgi:shikimate kinase